MIFILNKIHYILPVVMIFLWIIWAVSKNISPYDVGLAGFEKCVDENISSKMNDATKLDEAVKCWSFTSISTFENIGGEVKAFLMQPVDGAHKIVRVMNNSDSRLYGYFQIYISSLYSEKKIIAPIIYPKNFVDINLHGIDDFGEFNSISIQIENVRFIPLY